MIDLSFASKVFDRLRVHTADRVDWKLPDMGLLEDVSEEETDKELSFEPPVDPAELEHVISRYGIRGKFRDLRIGSSVTTYEVEVPVGTKLGSIMRYQSDIARDLRAPSLRIIGSLHSSSLVGFEVENPERFSVSYKKLFGGIPEGMKLPVILGDDTYGNPVYADLTSMPHLLVAGRTGSGKSVFLNTLILTLVSRLTPSEVEFKIVDPKQVEFTLFEHLPHVKDEIAGDAVGARELLASAVEEMERRFELFREERVKKIDDYNRTADEKLPYVVFIVDEFADLMLMSSGPQRKAVENDIVRIAQKARAVGIHMVLATQKPLAKVMTTLIKANMPARIAFSVTSSGDSRVILEDSGAESLIGKGDMLFVDPTARWEHQRLRRIQAPYVSDEDIEMLLGG